MLATLWYSVSLNKVTGTTATGTGVPSGKHGCADQVSGANTPEEKDMGDFRSLTRASIFFLSFTVFIIIRSFVRFFVNPSVSPFVCKLIYSFFRPSVRPLVRSSVSPSIRPFVRLSVRLSIRLSVQAFIRACMCVHTKQVRGSLRFTYSSLTSAVGSRNP